MNICSCRAKLEEGVSMKKVRTILGTVVLVAMCNVFYRVT